MLHSKISTKLNYAIRFSGSPIEKEETVAQHIAAMQLMAIELYNIFLNNGLTFNIRDLCYRIALHDLDEGPMGDIPRPIKYHDDKIRAEMERVAKEELAKNYHKEILEAVESSKDDTLEGKIVDLLDSLQCVYRLRVSNSFSNRFKWMLDESIRIAKEKIFKLGDDSSSSSEELKLLKEVAWAELLDDVV